MKFRSAGRDRDVNLDSLDMGGSPRSVSASIQPGLDRLLELCGCRQVVGDQLGDKGPGGTVVLELFDDVGMGRRAVPIAPWTRRRRVAAGRAGIPKRASRSSWFDRRISASISASSGLNTCFARFPAATLQGISGEWASRMHAAA
jgi:hypothetical protein